MVTTGSHIGNMTPLQLPIKSVKKGQGDYHMVSCSSDGGGGSGQEVGFRFGKVLCTW